MSAFSASHFHLAAQGFNGAVVEPITFSDSSASAVWANLDNSNLNALLSEDLYINVHTLTNPTGEIRGQVLTSDYNNVGSVITDVNNNATNNPLPANYDLSQNYPNPFNPSTVINYSLPQNSIVTLKVYDVLGREVATLVNQEQRAGSYKVQFGNQNLTETRQISSGIYFYRLIAGSYVQTKKMLLLK